MPQDVYLDIELHDMPRNKIPPEFFKYATIDYTGLNIEGKKYGINLRFESGRVSPDGRPHVSFEGHTCLKSAIKHYEVLKGTLIANGCEILQLDEEKAKLSQIYACSHCKAGKGTLHSTIAVNCCMGYEKITGLITDFCGIVEIEIPIIRVVYEELSEEIKEMSGFPTESFKRRCLEKD